LAARLLRLPDEFTVSEGMAQIDIDALAAARAFAEHALGTELRDRWLSAYHSLGFRGAYSADARSTANRRLRNVCLGYLAAAGDREAIELCCSQLANAGNLTDALAALTALSHIDCPQRIAALEDFYSRWSHNDLVVNKWLFVQGCSRLPGTAARVRELMGHPAFDITNRAKVMALVGGFCRRNGVQFHDPSGAGYRLLREALLAADAMHIENTYWLMPQIMQWRRFDPLRQSLMRAELEYILARPGISAGLYETVSNALREPAAA
jgi:aminopeptidase N